MEQNINFGRIIPTLPVADVDQTAAYYTNQLGFEETFRDGDRFAHIKRGDAVIALYRYADLQERTGCQDMSPPSKTRATIFVQGIDDLYQEYLSSGVNVIERPTEVPYGKDMQIEDCNGHIIEFVDFGPEQ